ncbi:MAG: 50S ribosomal protein L23 [Candidatus Marsarchaeota archaeon]|nr:50S ribosomal protein L23 [Candidatus Marsarchaeota archaeon]MCL5418741.1 50S ribosomal protein L23 [Candidatus Marsarchaeota archaeon]
MSVLMYPLATEKAIGKVEKENVITYIVSNTATKASIKEEFEKAFEVKVSRVNTENLPTNTKKAYIKLAKGFKASDVAVKLKLV